MYNFLHRSNTITNIISRSLCSLTSRKQDRKENEEFHVGSNGCFAKTETTNSTVAADVSLFDLVRKTQTSQMAPTLQEDS